MIKKINFVFGKGNWFISVLAGIVFSMFFLLCAPVFFMLFCLCSVITFFAGIFGFIKKDDSETYAGYDGHR